MSNVISITGNQMTMSSREIAELCDKRHDNVMADIRGMLLELNLATPDFSGVYIADNNQQYECFNLPRRECDILVSGYSIKYRAAIVDRWQELEEGGIPKTYVQALRKLADTVEENEALQIKCAEAIRTKAEIGSKREATAMATASIEKRRANKLQEELGISQDWKQAKAITWLADYFDLTKVAYQQIGRKLTSISNELGKAPKAIDSSEYNVVKAYHCSVIAEFFKRVTSDNGFLNKYRKKEEMA